MLQKYVCAENGGGMGVTVDRDVASSWETFRVRCLTHCYVLILIFFLMLLCKQFYVTNKWFLRISRFDYTIGYFCLNFFFLFTK